MRVHDDGGSTDECSPGVARAFRVARAGRRLPGRGGRAASRGPPASHRDGHRPGATGPTASATTAPASRAASASRSRSPCSACSSIGRGRRRSASASTGSRRRGPAPAPAGCRVRMGPRISPVVGGSIRMDSRTLRAPSSSGRTLLAGPLGTTRSRARLDRSSLGLSRPLARQRSDHREVRGSELSRCNENPCVNEGYPCGHHGGYE